MMTSSLSTVPPTPGPAAPSTCARPPPPPSPRTKWTRRVPHPVLIGHAASLTPYSGAPRGVRAEDPACPEPLAPGRGHRRGAHGGGARRCASAPPHFCSCECACLSVLLRVFPRERARESAPARRQRADGPRSACASAGRCRSRTTRWWRSRVEGFPARPCAGSGSRGAESWTPSPGAPPLALAPSLNPDPNHDDPSMI
jgi:hypothetical protein